MVSVARMLEQCKGLLGTRSITQWEDNFLQDVIGWGSKDSRRLTAKEVEKLEEIWKKHFAG